MKKNSIKIKEFINRSIGEWKSSRSTHTLAFNEFENTNSDISISFIPINDKQVEDLLVKFEFNNKPEFAVSITWQSRSDWTDEIQVKKDRKRVELSLKSVSEERRRDTVQAWKNEERANQIMRVAAERVGWDDAKTAEISSAMTESFGTLYGALEECAISDSALIDAGFEGDWTGVVTSLAMENIIPPFVEIRGVFEIQVWGEEGVYAIRDALLGAEACADGLEEVTLTCHYDGAPSYRVDIRAPDYQVAESLWESAVEAVKKSMSTVNGSLSIDRS